MTFRSWLAVDIVLNLMTGTWDRGTKLVFRLRACFKVADMYEVLASGAIVLSMPRLADR